LTPSAETTLSGIALLGRQDHPTDALEDYSRQLAGALQRKRFSLDVVRARWDEVGWSAALRDIEKRVAENRGQWVLAQYTALAWSNRGFPVKFAQLVRKLKRAGARILIVFHDSGPYPGNRLIDRVRQRVQLAVMRRAARMADRIVSTTSVERVPWMQKPEILAKTRSIPVGSNLPAVPREAREQGSRALEIVTFGVNDVASKGPLIASVVRRASEEIGAIHLTVFGRGAKAAEEFVRPILSGSRVELEVFDILEPERAANILANADVQLFVRAGLTSSRGSAIAGIVNGLPVVGFSDHETGPPITEAGVRLVPVGDREGLVRELVAVLKDPALRESLRERNLQAAEKYFSWDCIADAYLSVLQNTR